MPATQQRAIDLPIHCGERQASRRWLDVAGAVAVVISVLIGFGGEHRGVKMDAGEGASIEPDVGAGKLARAGSN